jgi:competence protein ComEA
MPTPAERKALGFLAAVAIAGAAVRATGAASTAQTADAASRDALRRQVVAVESAGAAARRGRGRGSQRGATDASGTLSGRAAPASTKRANANPVSPGPIAPDPRSIFAPPTAQRGSSGANHTTSTAQSPVDIDLATAEELERLPRIGPALAQRIVKDRQELGPFGSLEGLERVRGVGPAMARTLAAYVTFSGTPRPSIAGGAGAGTASGRTRKSGVKTGREPRIRQPDPP